MAHPGDDSPNYNDIGAAIISWACLSNTWATAHARAANSARVLSVLASPTCTYPPAPCPLSRSRGEVPSKNARSASSDERLREEPVAQAAEWGPSDERCASAASTPARRYPFRGPSQSASLYVHPRQEPLGSSFVSLVSGACPRAERRVVKKAVAVGIRVHPCNPWPAVALPHPTPPPIRVWSGENFGHGGPTHPI
jgi:hypothetical protein